MVDSIPRIIVSGGTQGYWVEHWLTQSFKVNISSSTVARFQFSGDVTGAKRILMV